jgi:predicted phosphodiesterase
MSHMTLSALSRRAGRFLVFCALVACAFAGCGQPPTAVAPPGPGSAQQTFAPFTFIQAGDPQIGGWGTVEETKARFVQLAHQANRLQPAAVVVVGDLVNDGPDEKELAGLDETLQVFRVPVKLVPGNHDDLATYRRKYGSDRYSFTVHNCEFVCINSNLLTPPRPTDEQRVQADEQRVQADEQWKWLEETLDQARQRKRTHIFLVLHHPPESLPSALRLDSLFRRYGVGIVLAGHVHKTTQVSLPGHITYTVAGTAWAPDETGFGFRLFKVYADRVEQEFVPLGELGADGSRPAPASRAASAPAAK